MQNGPRASIIILNWNGWRDTIECLESIYKITDLNYDTIVVDNGSDDESLEKIREYAEGQLEVTSKFFSYSTDNKPLVLIEYSREVAEGGGGKEDLVAGVPSNKRLILIKNGNNDGFAKGNNIGINYALNTLNPDYIILLNSDTVVKHEFLSELVWVAEQNEEIGILCPKLLKLHDPATIDSTGHIFRWGRIVDRGDGEKDRGQYDDKKEIIGAIAAACLYRKGMLEEIGLFDESFITGYEDAELSWRAYKHGWKAQYVPTSLVYHKRGASINKNKDISTKMGLYYIKNVTMTVKRYATPLQKIQFTILWLKFGVFSLVGSVIGRNSIGIKPYLFSLVELYNNDCDQQQR